MPKQPFYLIVAPEHRAMGAAAGGLVARRCSAGFEAAVRIIWRFNLRPVHWVQIHRRCR